MPFDLYRQGYEYYWKTHAHPGSTFKYTMSSLLDLMRWDATDQIELIDQPLLMIAGSKADSLYMTEDAFAKATGTKDKELFKIDGATHIETYWVPEVCGCRNGQADAVFRPDPCFRPLITHQPRSLPDGVSIEILNGISLLVLIPGGLAVPAYAQDRIPAAPNATASQQHSRAQQLYGDIWERPGLSSGIGAWRPSARSSP